MTRAKIVVNDYYHPAATMTTLLTPLQRSGTYSLAVSEAPNDGDSLGLESFDLLVLGAMGTLRPRESKERWLSPTGEERIAAFVQAGGGLLVLHSALAGYPPVGPLRSVVRGTFAHHPKEHPLVTIRPTTSDHPIVADVEAFTITDEQYFVEIDEAETRVLAEAESAEHGAAPAVFCHEIGRGRVAVVTPGHTEEVARNLSLQRLVINAADWVSHKT